MSPVVCDVCSRLFKDRFGLLTHCRSAEHRRKQLAAESAAEAERLLAASGPATLTAFTREQSGPSDGQSEEQSGSEGHRSPDQLLQVQTSPENDDTQPPPEREPEPGVEEARVLASSLLRDLQPSVLNYRPAPKPLPLPASVAPLPPLLLNLSGADRDRMLKVIHHKDFSPELIPWKSADQLHDFLDKYVVRVLLSPTPSSTCCNFEFTACTACRGSAGDIWYGELLLLFSFKTRGPVKPEVVLVRWFIPAPKPPHAKHLRLECFQYAKCRVAGIPGKVFQTDVVPLISIIGPCFMQQDPVHSSIFYFNHWVGNTANSLE